VERTLTGDNPCFEDEPLIPKLNNLATHAKECKKRYAATVEDAEDEDPIEEQINLKKSVELMREYLRNGDLNPNIAPTQKGFLRLFAAWILDESLPWTTGEAPTLALLFKYLKVNFKLPSDTTVRNQLALIFKELHGKVVREFTVSNNQTLHTFD